MATFNLLLMILTSTVLYFNVKIQKVLSDVKCEFMLQSKVPIANILTFFIKMIYLSVIFIILLLNNFKITIIMLQNVIKTWLNVDNISINHTTKTNLFNVNHCEYHLQVYLIFAIMFIG